MNAKNKLASMLMALAIGFSGAYALANCGTCEGVKDEGCKEKVCPLEKKSEGCKDKVCPAEKKCDKACCPVDVKKAEAKSEQKGE